MYLKTLFAALVAVTISTGASFAATVTAATAEIDASFVKTNSPTMIEIEGSGTFNIFTDFTTVRDYILSFKISGNAERPLNGGVQTFSFSKSDTLGPATFALIDGPSALANFFPISSTGVFLGFSNTLFDPNTGAGSTDFNASLVNQPALDLLTYVTGGTPDFPFTGDLNVEAELTYTPVPLPATLPMLLFGVGALAWGARRRKT